MAKNGISQILPNLGGWCFKLYANKIKTNEWNDNQLIFFTKARWWHPRWLRLSLKMAIYQFRLNRERGCVRFYGSINPIESVKLPSVNYLDESKMTTSKMAVSKMASFCCLASKHRFIPAVTFDIYIGRQQR